MKKRIYFWLGLAACACLLLSGCPTVKNSASPSPTAPADPLLGLDDPTASYAYAITSGGSWTGGISCYTVDRNGLNMFEPVALAASPTGITVHPTLPVLYVSGMIYNGGDPQGYLYQYPIGSDGRLGAMTSVSCDTFDCPESFLILPTGNYAYLIDAIDYGIYRFTVGANGALSNGLLLATSILPFSISIDHGGRYLYATYYDGIYQYSINAADGTLTAMTPASVTASGQMFGPVIDPSDSSFYASDSMSNTIYQYSIGPTGGLTALTPPSLSSEGVFPYNSAIHPNGTTLYLLSAAGIERYCRSLGGSLSRATVTAITGGGLDSIFIDSTGQYAFVSAFNSEEPSDPINGIHQYGIIDSSGTLMELTTNFVPVSGLVGFALYR
jgi:6-phosphogluconolactonase (cycloisomerase 2 family)